MKHIHKLVLPPQGARDVLAWDGENFVPWNGLPAKAFVYRNQWSVPIAATSVMHESSCLTPCLCRAAMDACVKRWHCANGAELPPVKPR